MCWPRRWREPGSSRMTSSAIPLRAGLRRRLYVARECGAALEEAGAAAELPQQVGGASAGRGVGCVVGELGRYVGPLSAER